jgi:hypothetical protein
MAWFYKDNNLYVPIGNHEEDLKWRQQIFGVQGLDKDVIIDGHFLVKNARKLKVKEMREDSDLQYQYLLIDCYSYLFNIGNACSYLPDQHRLILIDERPTKRVVGKTGTKGTGTYIKCSDQSMILDIRKVFEKGIDRLVDDDEIGWYEGNNMKIKLVNMLESKGWVFPTEEEVGECCFCKGPCNPQSQSCGRCARKLW